jgi:GPH family glycoside/pentoside/hexuronide:cation symporter
MKRWHKITYAAGSLGTALSYQAFANRIQFLYIDELRVAAVLIGAVWFLYGLWNAINDPLMGQLSDNTRSQWGRRIPYVAGATLPMVLFFILMWTPPRQAAEALPGALPPLDLSFLGAGVVQISHRDLLLGGYFLVMVFLFDTLWTLVVIAWTALFPEMVHDLKDRAAVSGWRETFSVVGLILALALTPIIVDQIGYRGMALAFGAVTAISFFVSLLGSREDPSRHTGEESVPLGKAIRASLVNRSFAWFLLANLGKEFVFLIVVAALPFYAKYALRLRDIPGGLDAATQEALLLGVPFILAVPGLFVWTKITQRIGSRKAWIAAQLAFIPGLLIMLLARSFTAGIVGTCVLVLGLPGLLMLYNLLIADVIDEDELNIGHRREGMYFGMNGAIIRLAFSAEGLLIAGFLGLTGYDPALAVQPVSAEWGIRFLMAGAPVLACLVTVFALWRYPLHGERLAAMRAKLEAAHQGRR